MTSRRDRRESKQVHEQVVRSNTGLQAASGDDGEIRRDPALGSGQHRMSVASGPRVSPPIVLQHVFGEPGTGGPIAALGRLLESDLARRYRMPIVRQMRPAGGVSLGLIKQMSQQIREARPDLIHIRGLGNEGFHAAVAAKRSGCPRVLVSIHGTHRDLGVGSPVEHARRVIVVSGLERATLAMADGIATVCRSAADRPFLDPYRDRLLGVVPNGVPAPEPSLGARQRLRRQWNLPADSVVATYVGRLTREKGLTVLAEAARALQPAAAKRLALVVVGDGPDRAAIEVQFKHARGVRTVMLGARLDIADILSASDIFVLPSFHENLSNALVEAMASGLAPIASGVGGNVEVLHPNAGIHVPPGDAQLLAEALDTLVLDDELRHALGERARKRHRESFTIERMVEGWSRVYERMLSRD